MKLQERLPRGITLGRRHYRMDFDFRNVLRMMEILARDDLLPDAREFLALRCLRRHPPRDAQGAINAVRVLLFPEAKEQTAGRQKLTDFIQDADLIRAAFRQAYGIDLYRDRLHWLEFSALLSCLPEGSRYSEVLGIRARPMPQATRYNSAEREWLTRAKAACALELSEQERARQYAGCLQNVFAGLRQMALKEGEGHE